MCMYSSYCSICGPHTHTNFQSIESQLMNPCVSSHNFNSVVAPSTYSTHVCRIVIMRSTIRIPLVLNLFILLVVSLVVAAGADDDVNSSYEDTKETIPESTTEAMTTEDSSTTSAGGGGSTANFTSSFDRQPFMSRGREHLVHYMMKNYDKNNFPANAGVKFGYTLMGLDYDEKTKRLGVDAWLRMEWMDPRFQWNPSDFGGDTKLHIPEDQIWKPDITLYNSRDPARNYGCRRENLVVKNTGKVTWIPACYMVPRCKLNLDRSPLAVQNCTLKFGSWSFDGDLLDLQLLKEAVDLSHFEDNDEWELVGPQGMTKCTKYYPGRTEPYLSVNANLSFKRKGSSTK